MFIEWLIEGCALCRIGCRETSRKYALPAHIVLEGKVPARGE